MRMARAGALSFTSYGVAVLDALEGWNAPLERMTREWLTQFDYGQAGPVEDWADVWSLDELADSGVDVDTEARVWRARRNVSHARVWRVRVSGQGRGRTLRRWYATEHPRPFVALVEIDAGRVWKRSRLASAGEIVKLLRRRIMSPLTSHSSSGEIVDAATEGRSLASADSRIREMLASLTAARQSIRDDDERAIA